MTNTRRDALLAGMTAVTGSFLAGATPALSASPRHRTAVASPAAKSLMGVGVGVEGQRKADLGNGSYLNPILAGDHPDPSILKDGKVYYLVSSSFEYYPGLVLWTSTDLINWSVVGPSLKAYVGSVFAPDLVKHQGRYFIYFAALNFMVQADPRMTPPAKGLPPLTTYVIHADHIEGPWSAPVDMKLPGMIDPGHAVGEDGQRYLFFDDGRRVPISADGLSAAGPVTKVYEGWKYPEDWIVEGFALEGPKMIFRQGWHYMFSAEGGTGGPPTGHMVIVARSRSLDGPWENCPHNPIIRTLNKDEPWWSKGHATPIQGPGGDWWVIYHAYENGYRTLGRETILEPLEWTADGWPRVSPRDLRKPIRKPAGGKPGPHGLALSTAFSSADLGARMTVYKPRGDYLSRFVFEEGGVTLKAQGAHPRQSSPLLLNSGDHRYEVTVDVELQDAAQAGLLIFYDERFFCGLAVDAKAVKIYKAGDTSPLMPAGPPIGRSFSLRLVNDDNIVTFFTKEPGAAWRQRISFDVAGYNHNVADGFLSLRPGLSAAGEGFVRYRNLRYQALG